MQSIKSRRKRYEACDDVVPVVGLDLPCAAGHLGLQSAPSALPRALGFEPQRQEISNTPDGGVAYLVPVVGLEPTRCRHRRILNPLRLPFHHTGIPWRSIYHLQQNFKYLVSHFSVSGAGDAAGFAMNHRFMSVGSAIPGTVSVKLYCHMSHA